MYPPFCHFHCNSLPVSASLVPKTTQSQFCGVFVLTGADTDKIGLSCCLKLFTGAERIPPIGFDQVHIEFQ